MISAPFNPAAVLGCSLRHLDETGPDGYLTGSADSVSTDRLSGTVYSKDPVVLAAIRALPGLASQASAMLSQATLYYRSLAYDDVLAIAAELGRGGKQFSDPLLAEQVRARLAGQASLCAREAYDCYVQQADAFLHRVLDLKLAALAKCTDVREVTSPCRALSAAFRSTGVYVSPDQHDERYVHVQVVRIRDRKQLLAVRDLAFDHYGSVGQRVLLDIR